MDTKTLLIVLTIIVILISGVYAFIKRGIKFALCIVAIFIIFTIGFIWLPKQVDRVLSGEMTVKEVIECIKNEDGCGIKESMNEGADLIEDKYNEFKEKIAENDNIENDEDKKIDE